MSKNDFLNRMKKATDNVNKFANLPYGSYFCLLQKAEQKENKKGKQMVTFTFKVIEGGQRSKTHRNFYNIENDVGFNILIQDLVNLGYPIEELSSPDDMIKLWSQIGTDKLHVNISITENPDPQYANFPRTRIEAVVDMGEGEADVAEEADVVEEEAEVEAEVEEDVAEEAPVVEEADVVEEDPATEAEEETEEEDFLDIGDVVDFTFKGKTFVDGKIKSASEDGLSCVIVCKGKPYKVKSENIIPK